MNKKPEIGKLVYLECYSDPKPIYEIISEEEGLEFMGEMKITNHNTLVSLLQKDIFFYGARGINIPGLGYVKRICGYGYTHAIGTDYIIVPEEDEALYRLKMLDQ